MQLFRDARASIAALVGSALSIGAPSSATAGEPTQPLNDKQAAVSQDNSSPSNLDEHLDSIFKNASMAAEGARLPPVTLDKATLHDIMVKRLDPNGRPIVFQEQKYGSQTFIPALRELQLILLELGADLGPLEADGLFGGKTGAAVGEVRVRNNLQPRSPEEIDSEVVQALFREKKDREIELASRPPGNIALPAPTTQPISLSEIANPFADSSFIEFQTDRRMFVDPIVLEVQQLLLAEFARDQKMLGEAGADGLFGPLTARVVELYQRSRGLEVRSPTRIDEPTLRSLREHRPSASMQQEIWKVINSPWFERLPVGWQYGLANAFASESDMGREMLIQMIKEPAFSAFTTDQHVKLFRVTLYLDQDERDSIQELLQARIGADKHPPLLDKDAEGKALIDTLSRIFFDPIHPALEKFRIVIATDLVRILGNPYLSDQHKHGTCGGTSIEYPLFEHWPAEAARIVCGLISPAGTVRLKSGETLSRVEDAFEPDDSVHRSKVEMLVQSAFMDFANGPYVKYLNKTDRNWNTIRKAFGPRGLADDEIARTLTAIHAQNFAVYASSDTMPGKEVLKRLETNKSPFTVFALHHYVPVTTDKEREYVGQKWIGHSVNYIRMDTGRNQIVIRDPNGPTSSPNGEWTTGHIPLLIIDGARGIKGIPLEKALNARPSVIMPLSTENN